MTQQQWVQDDGKEPEHAHPAQVHSHDHYHITHHHKGGVMGETSGFEAFAHQVELLAENARTTLERVS